MVLSCYQQPGKGPQKAPAVEMALKAPKDAPIKDAARKNDEGVSHLVQEHWDISNKFFHEAIQADPNLAVAHFNLGLSLDALGQHPEATEHFRKANELAPDEPGIADNEILKKHL
jgi:tetratricopeptide (TPR) repeat protein